MKSIMRALFVPGIAVLAALALAGCSSPSKPEVSASRVSRANPQTDQGPQARPGDKAEDTLISGPSYKADFLPLYRETHGARSRPARIFRDKRDVELNKMAEIGTLSTRIELRDCGPGVKCDATATLAREAAAKGGDYVLLTAGNKRERRPVEGASREELVSHGVVYRVGDFGLLAKAAVRRADEALRRAEAAERRADAAHKRAAEARRSMDASGAIETFESR